MQYFVSSSTGNNSNNGTSMGTPWQSESKVNTMFNNGTIGPGDIVSFKCGDSFTGTMAVQSIFGGSARSGTSTNPITINSYSTGAKPEMLYPTGGSATPEERTKWSFIGVDYYHITGLNFSDQIKSTNHISGANCGFPIYLGSFSDSTYTNHFLIDYINIEYCGMGIVITGDNNTVQYCTMSKFKNLKSTHGGNGEDYGANPFTIIWSNNNTIANNDIRDGWAESLDFGYNGGVCETIGTCSGNKIIFNTIVDCNGLAEFGQGGNSVNNLYAYNKIINCGAMFWVNSDTQLTNAQFFNNVVVENNNSRFAQGSTNAGAGVVTQEAIDNLNVDVTMFEYQSNSQSAVTVFNLKNNVFQVSNPLKIIRSSSTKALHDHNIYKLSGGSSLQNALGTGEVSTAAALFVNTLSSDPSLWDFTPVGAGPLIAAGAGVGLTRDFVGNTVGVVVDAGIIQSDGGIVVPPPVKNGILSVKYKHLTSCRNTANGTITAQFTGTNTPFQYKITGQNYSTATAATLFQFTGLARGNYTINVLDAAGFTYEIKTTMASRIHTDC